MAGGKVAANSGGAAYEGVQAPHWSDLHYWHPDPGPDRYKHHWGFPEYPGLLEEALRPIQAEGVRLPWLSCYGNHDALVLGTARPNPRYEQIVKKQVELRLEECGASAKLLNDTIRQCLTKQPPVLPTAQEIWSKVKIDMALPLFERFLTLLGQCGAARCSQRKLYLHIDV